MCGGRDGFLQQSVSGQCRIASFLCETAAVLLPPERALCDAAVPAILPDWAQRAPLDSFIVRSFRARSQAACSDIDATWHCTAASRRQIGGERFLQRSLILLSYFRFRRSGPQNESIRARLAVPPVEISLQSRLISFCGHRPRTSQKFTPSAFSPALHRDHEPLNELGHQGYS